MHKILRLRRFTIRDTEQLKVRTSLQLSLLLFQVLLVLADIKMKILHNKRQARVSAEHKREIFFLLLDLHEATRKDNRLPCLHQTRWTVK